jgi:hypothetical protein
LGSHIDTNRIYFGNIPSCRAKFKTRDGAAGDFTIILTVCLLAIHHHERRVFVFYTWFFGELLGRAAPSAGELCDVTATMQNHFFIVSWSNELLGKRKRPKIALRPFPDRI